MWNRDPPGLGNPQLDDPAEETHQAHSIIIPDLQATDRNSHPQHQMHNYHGLQGPLGIPGASSTVINPSLSGPSRSSAPDPIEMRTTAGLDVIRDGSIRATPTGQSTVSGSMSIVPGVPIPTSPSCHETSQHSQAPLEMISPPFTGATIANADQASQNNTMRQHKRYVSDGGTRYSLAEHPDAFRAQFDQLLAVRGTFNGHRTASQAYFHHPHDGPSEHWTRCKECGAQQGCLHRPESNPSYYQSVRGYAYRQFDEERPPSSLPTLEHSTQRSSQSSYASTPTFPPVPYSRGYQPLNLPEPLATPHAHHVYNHGYAQSYQAYRQQHGYPPHPSHHPIPTPPERPPYTHTHALPFPAHPTQPTTHTYPPPPQPLPSQPGPTGAAPQHVTIPLTTLPSTLPPHLTWRQVAASAYWEEYHRLRPLETEAPLPEALIDQQILGQLSSAVRSGGLAQGEGYGGEQEWEYGGGEGQRQEEREERRRWLQHAWWVGRRMAREVCGVRDTRRLGQAGERRGG